MPLQGWGTAPDMRRGFAEGGWMLVSPRKPFLSRALPGRKGIHLASSVPRVMAMVRKSRSQPHRVEVSTSRSSAALGGGLWLELATSAQAALSTEVLCFGSAITPFFMYVFSLSWHLLTEITPNPPPARLCPRLCPPPPPCLRARRVLGMTCLPRRI